MTDLAHILRLQRFGYTDIRKHEKHGWCGRRGDYACIGIQEDGSYTSARDCGGGMEAVRHLDSLDVPAALTEPILGSWMVFDGKTWQGGVL
jgi:hypothetical protein